MCLLMGLAFMAISLCAWDKQDGECRLAEWLNEWMNEWMNECSSNFFIYGGPASSVYAYFIKFFIEFFGINSIDYPYINNVLINL